MPGNEQKADALPSSPAIANTHVIGSQCPQDDKWWIEKTSEQRYLDSLSDWSPKRIFIEIRNYLYPDRDEIPGMVLLGLPVLLGIIVIVLALICM